ncbi:MAG: helix-turn-helix transcriptional regulator [Victivallales bacterium]|nr:helix-turn-helix transcriptional regulator [Victivallales bacterium]
MSVPELLIKQDNTRVFGTNAGKYPLHHFIHNTGVEFERNWPLKVITCGDDEWIKGCSRIRECSNIFSVELVTGGSFEFTQSGHSYTVKPGGIMLIQPGKDSSMEVFEYSTKKIMTLSGYMLPMMLAGESWSAADVIVPSHPERICKYFDRIYQVYLECKPGCLKEGSSLAYELLLELSEDIDCGGLPRMLSRIICYLEENISAGIGIKDLCLKFGTSPASLYRMFKKHLDCSPADYISGKKLAVAKELLQSSNYSIKEISLRLGYSSPFYFSTEFKRRNGVSPRDYRTETESKYGNQIK